MVWIRVKTTLEMGKEHYRAFRYLNFFIQNNRTHFTFTIASVDNMTIACCAVERFTHTYDNFVLYLLGIYRITVCTYLH